MAQTSRFMLYILSMTACRLIGSRSSSRAPFGQHFMNAIIAISTNIHDMTINAMHITAISVSIDILCIMIRIMISIMIMISIFAAAAY